jgi:hypothetical protein
MKKKNLVHHDKLQQKHASTGKFFVADAVMMAPPKS